MENEELTRELLDWMAIFMRLSMHDFSHYAHSTGLSLSQMNVLYHLYYKGPSEIMQFCNLMQLSAAGVSQTVERMVQQGVVYRVEDTNDRRVRRLHLTEQGRHLVEESIAARQAWLGKMIQQMDEDEKAIVSRAIKLLKEKTPTEA